MFNSMDNLSGVARIKVVGVGGAGNNAVNRMIEAEIHSASYVAVNTDKQILLLSKAENKIQIGGELTKGLGAGADPEIGRMAAEESKEALTEAIRDTDLLFITAGMGGGTGTGASPVIASIAKEMGKLTVAVVTKPFAFEGKPRMANANIGIENLKKVVDTIVIIPNEKLMEFVPNLPIKDAFRHADDVLRQGIQGISDLIVTPALINLDFADVCTVMRNSGVAHMGIGRGKGEKRVLEAVKRAVFSPLLETSIEGASKIILNIMGSPDMTLNEINEATSLVREVVQPNANIIFGADIRETMKEEIMVTMIATGFNNTDSSAQSSQQKTQAAPIDDPFRAEYDAMFDQRFGAQHAGFGQPARPQQPVNQYPTGNQAPRPVQQQQAPRGSRMTVDEDDDMPAWMRKLKK